MGWIGPALAGAAEPLVSQQWLKHHRADPDLVVLDIRSAIDGGGAEAYVQGHIPGAVHSDYDKGGWRVTRNGVPFMLPDAARLEALVGDLGIDEDSHVVVVPAGVHVLDFGSAARVYWTLKAAGHPRVSILDGGFAAWKADPANPIETGVNRPSPKIFTVAFDHSLHRAGRRGRAREQVGRGDPARCASRAIFHRQGKGSGCEGLRPHPRCHQPGQCGVL